MVFVEGGDGLRLIAVAGGRGISSQNQFAISSPPSPAIHSPYTPLASNVTPIYNTSLPPPHTGGSEDDRKPWQLRMEAVSFVAEALGAAWKAGDIAGVLFNDNLQALVRALRRRLADSQVRGRRRWRRECPAA